MRYLVATASARTFIVIVFVLSIEIHHACQTGCHFFLSARMADKIVMVNDNALSTLVHPSGFSFSIGWNGPIMFNISEVTTTITNKVFHLFVKCFKMRQSRLRLLRVGLVDVCELYTS